MANGFLSSRARIFAFMLAVSVVGNALDLIGTYIAQPTLATEGNPIYRLLTARGVHVTWPMVFLGKSVVIAAAAWLTTICFRIVPRNYPEPGASLGEFFKHTFNRKDVSILRSLFSLSKTRIGTLTLIGPSVLLAGPYYVYLGYGNLAWLYRWPDFSALHIGFVRLDPIVFVCAIGAFWGAVYLMWLDYRISTENQPSPSVLQPS